MTKIEPVRLHLGCGKRFIPGFVHIDLAEFAHINYNCGIDKLPMFEDGTVDLIYSSHSFEYFDRHEALNVLAEWRRVLKQGGLLRVAVPDFESLVRLYRSTGTLANILGPLYGRMEIETSAGRNVIYHKTVYDFEDLRRILEANGFCGVRRYDWRETIHRDYDDHSQAYFPHLDKEKGLLISLNVEATKR